MYLIGRKFGGGKFGKFGESSVIRQTNLVLRIDNLLADLRINSPNFLSPNAQKESIRLTFSLPNFSAIR